MLDYLRLPDSDLIERCLAADDVAWEALTRRYQRLIASVTIKYGLNKEDSADVFQSVCLALLRQMVNLRNQSRLSSWLITVTVRECWKLRHRCQRAINLDSEAWEQVAQSSHQTYTIIEGQLLRIEKQFYLRQSIEMLPGKCRSLIESLFYTAPPPSYAEISQQLDIPVASIGSLRGRCIAKLRRQLQALGY